MNRERHTKTDLSQSKQNKARDQKMEVLIKFKHKPTVKKSSSLNGEQLKTS